MRKPTAAVLATTLLLTACRVGPDYERPTVPTTESFRFATDGALASADTAWWQEFQDPVLTALIEEALRNNYDVRIAAARVQEFAARIGITRSEAFPQIGYDAGVARNQNSRELGAPVPSRISDFFEANLNVGWELDVFGRIRRATDAAVADTLATEEARRAVILSLVTSVATSYIALRSLDEQLAISRAKLETREDTVRIFGLQFERGIISRLELAQIESELERTAATIPAIERDIAQVENSLSTLLGRPPGPIRRGSTLAQLTSPPLPEGLPSDLLRQRPDLREAEFRVIAATERIGVAVADFYPRFSLTGSLGVASDSLSDLFDNTATTFTAAAGVLGPLFTAGFLENQLAAAEAIELQAVETYRATILTAFREAEDALVTQSTTERELAAQTRQEEALSRYASLAQQRYDNGFVRYLEVLDAERDLFDAELQRVQLRAALLASSVGIYKAFGGGWVDIADEIVTSADEAPPKPGQEPKAPPTG